MKAFGCAGVPIVATVRQALRKETDSTGNVVTGESDDVVGGLRRLREADLSNQDDYFPAARGGRVCRPAEPLPDARRSPS